MDRALSSYSGTYLDALAELGMVEAVHHWVGHGVSHSEDEQRLAKQRVQQLERLLVNPVPEN